MDDATNEKIEAPKPHLTRTRWILGSIAGLLILLIAPVVWHFSMGHKFATLQLGEHKLVFKIEYELDLFSVIVCELSGPKQHHGPVGAGFIGAGQRPPTFTVHQSTNPNVFWVTPDPMPNLIVYALDANTGEFWFVHSKEKSGDKFLSVANAGADRYKLYQFEWFGAPN
jgi:hypothetical protein